ncbi:unnamed protein product, partial [Urochloa humidicola]
DLLQAPSCVERRRQKKEVRLPLLAVAVLWVLPEEKGLAHPLKKRFLRSSSLVKKLEMTMMSVVVV